MWSSRKVMMMEVMKGREIDHKSVDIGEDGDW